MGNMSVSLIFVGKGASTGDGARGVGAFFRWDCGVASETRRLAGSRRSRGGSLRFSAMTVVYQIFGVQTIEWKPAR